MESEAGAATRGPARAVGWHLEDRVIVHQNRTTVFS
jgi:formyltetrahydrofolate hydrolase